jgi:hypothetical protein
MYSINYSIKSFSMELTFRMTNTLKMQRMSEKKGESVPENAKSIVPTRVSLSSLIVNIEMQEERLCLLLNRKNVI